MWVRGGEFVRVWVCDKGGGGGGVGGGGGGGGGTSKSQPCVNPT